MKKNKFLIFLLIVINFLSPVMAKAHDQNDQLAFNQLVTLESQTVKNFKSYLFTVTWIGDQPLIKIAQVNKNFISRTANLRDIVTVEPSQSSFEEGKTMVALSAFKHFSVSKVIPAEKIEIGEDLIQRFDAYDSENHIRMSEWRSTQNGFLVEEMIFKKDGNPLSLTYFDDYEINIEDDSLDYSGKHFHFPLDYLFNRFGPVDLEQSATVIDVCKKLLQKALENQ